MSNYKTVFQHSKNIKDVSVVKTANTVWKDVSLTAQEQKKVQDLYSQALNSSSSRFRETIEILSKR